MKVKYIIDNIEQHSREGLTRNEEEYYSRWSKLPSHFNLTKDELYTVYGLDFKGGGGLDFLIVNDQGLRYPSFYPSEFFEIVDPRISRFWNTKANLFPLKDIKKGIISNPEIADNDSFFNDILESEETMNLFEKLKAEMDLEFPRDDIKYATIIEGHWITCSYCGETWEEQSKNGIVVCPYNGEYNNNPHTSLSVPHWS